MSEQILTLLKSDDPAERKRGIGAAAKSTDKRFLKPLAAIYKTDPDPQLRQLAKKAGVYITKQSTPSDDALSSLRGEMLHGVDKPLSSSTGSQAVAQPASPATGTARADAPRLGDLLDGNVPDAERDPDTAKVHYNTAFDLHLKGNDAHAALELGTAFRLNPAYAQDKTAVAFAAELTGKPQQEAAPYIADPANWRTITDQLGGLRGRVDANENLRGMFLWVFGAIGVFIFGLLVLAFINGPLFEATIRQFVENTFGGFFGNESPVGSGAVLFLGGISSLRRVGAND